MEFFSLHRIVFSRLLLGNFISSSGYEHFECNQDEDIPFTPDGNDPVISSNVIKVRGTTGRFKGKIAARKTFILNRKDERQLELSKRRVTREAKILHTARHDHILDLVATYFYNISEGETIFAIVTDRADANLQEHINRGQEPLDHWFNCLSSAVTHIHELKIRHLDIKPESVLIKRDRILLSGFGMAEIGHEKAYTAPGWPITRPAAYTAPEVESGGPYDQSADIFSLGGIFLELLIFSSNDCEYFELQRELGFGGDKSYSRNIERIQRWMKHKAEENYKGQELANRRKHEILCLCQRMLEYNKSRRITTGEFKAEWAKSPLTNPSSKCPCCELPPGTPSTKPDPVRRTNSYESKMTHLRIKELEKAIIEERPDTTRPKGNNGAMDQAQFVNGRVDEILRYKLGMLALHCAAIYNDKITVEALVQKKADLIREEDDEGQVALHLAAGYGNDEVVQFLLNASERGTDPQYNINPRDIWGQTPLHLAAKNGHEKVFEALLNKGADIQVADKDGRRAFHYAALSKNKQVIEIIMKKKPSFDFQVDDHRHQTALHYAARNKFKASQEILKILLDKGVNSMAKNDDGHTALHIASRYGSKKVVEALLENGANIEATDIEGESALHIAARYGSEEIVDTLLRKKVFDIGMADHRGRTALHLAAQRRSTQVIRLLLNNGADVRVKDSYGQTALHLAAEYGSRGVVEELLKERSPKAKVDVEATDRWGHTALHLAAGRGDQGVFDLLRKNGRAGIRVLGNNRS
jgi:ankyrin repeat protein/serine/threonine protein kinase